MSAGSNKTSISVDAFDVKIAFMRLGQNKIISETTKHIIPVKIKPDETREPIAFLSFCPEK